RTRCTSRRLPARMSIVRRLRPVAFLIAFGMASAMPPAAPATPVASRYFDYVQGGRVCRLSLASLRSTLLFEILPDATPARAESIAGGGGSIAWLARRKPEAALLTWDGQHGSAFPLERRPFGMAGFQLEYDANHEIVQVIPEYQETVLDEFLVSADGRRVAWDVNLVAGMTPDSSGTIYRRHLVFESDLDGRNQSQVLDERYSVPYLFAD